jgi:hypothetical protein
MMLGLDIIGARTKQTLVGAFNLSAVGQNFASLKQVPVSVAQVLLVGGQGAIDSARKLVDLFNLHGDGGDKKRDEVYWKLQWHQTELAKYASTPHAIYPSGADLKDWVEQAFIAYNAAEEGAGTNVVAKAWDDYVDMWDRVGAAIAALPGEVAQAIKTAAGAAGTAVKTVWWTTVALVGGAALIVGLIAWKLVSGGTVRDVGTAYLGGRR